MPGSFSPGLGDRIEERYELAAQLRVCAVARTFLAVDEYTGQNVALTLFDPACVTATSWANYVKVVAAASAAKVAGLVLPHTVPAALPDSPHVACDPQIDRGLDRLREQGPLPWQRALTIGERIVEILAAVHARTAVAHHGLTPARCLVSARDEVKLLDYGVAEFERTRTDDAEYRAPSWPAPVADVRPDIHSLAVMLFELICEARPQPGQSLRRLVPVPHAVDELMTRALATDPQQQYADLDGLRTDLRQALGLPPLQPAPPPEEAPPPVTTTPPPIAAREQAPIAAPAWTRLGSSRGATRPELEPMPSSAPRPESTLELRPEPPRPESTLELQPEPPRKEQTLELRPEPPGKESTLELPPGLHDNQESTLELQTRGAPHDPATRPEPREETVIAPVRAAGKAGAQRSVQTTTGAQRTLQSTTGPQRALQSTTGPQRTPQTRTGAQRTLPAGATRPTPASEPSAASSGTRAAAASASATNMRVAAAASASATNMRVAAAASASAPNMKDAAESTPRPPPARVRSPATSSPSMRLRAVQAAIAGDEAPADADRTVIARRPGAPRQPRLDVTDKLPTDVLDAVHEAHRAQSDAPTSDSPPRRPRLDPTDRLPSDVLAAVHDEAGRSPGPPPTPGPPSPSSAAPPRPPPPSPPGPPSLTPAAPPRPPPPRAAPPVVRTVVAPPPQPPVVAAPPQPAAPAATSAAPTKPASFEIPAQVAAAVSAIAARPAAAASPSSRSPLTPLKKRLLYLNVGLVTLLLLALVIGLAL